jgi:hypothetical protein
LKLFKWTCAGVGMTVLCGAVLWWREYSSVHEPISKSIAEDARNSGYEISASYAGLLDTSTLVLDLGRVDRAAPLDLLRGVFLAAAAMEREHERFETVVLARGGEPVFVLSGSDFSSLGSEFGGGQNPVYLVRTFPEKLKTPYGTAAFSTWSGGALGVVGAQMKDVNDAAHQWAAHGR